MKFFLMTLLMIFGFAFSANALSNNENNPHVSVVDLGSVTTTGTDTYGLYFPKRAKILGFYIVDTAGIVASDTNYVTLELKSGSTQIAKLDSRAAFENGLAALTPKAGTVVSSTALVAAGSYLKVTYSEAGTVGMTTAKAFVLWASQ